MRRDMQGDLQLGELMTAMPLRTTKRASLLVLLGCLGVLLVIRGGFRGSLAQESHDECWGILIASFPGTDIEEFMPVDRVSCVKAKIGMLLSGELICVDPDAAVEGVVLAGQANGVCEWKKDGEVLALLGGGTVYRLIRQRKGTGGGQ